MKQPIFVANVPIDEKRISFIEKIMLRLARRSRKVVKAMISPIPISICVLGENISGTIMKALLFEGTVNRIAIQFDKKPKNDIRVDILTGDIGEVFKISKSKEVLDLDISTKDGDVLGIYVMPNEEDILTEVLLSILWTPSKQNIEIKSFLIDELEESVVGLLEE